MRKSKYTTIDAELKRMEEVVKIKVKDFRPARHLNLTEQIFHLFKSSSKAHIDPIEEEKILDVIKYYLKEKTPIKISFLWALYWMVQSPWKFIECNIIKPRLGDYWAPYWLSMINRKLKKIFPPGCKFYVINEQEMVKEMGWTNSQSRERMSCLSPIYSKSDCVKIIDLPKFNELPKIQKPNDEEIIATVISTPALFSQISEESMKFIMDEFYVDRNKIFSAEKSLLTPSELDDFYNQIDSFFFSADSSQPDNKLKESPAYLKFMALRAKNIVGVKKIIPDDIWDKGIQIKRKMNQIAKARRSSGWLDNKVMEGEPFIDAAIINRGRWSPDIWAFTSPQHGGSILDLDNRLYSISIAPEYRLQESEKHEPVKVKDSGEEFTLYWLKI